jgi:CRISPR-associated protein Cmr5
MATAPNAAGQRRPTLEQRRAQHAWEKAKEGVERFSKDYANDAKGLPALIMSSGLMQVMAFLHEKGGRHGLLAQHLRDWLHQQCGTPREFEGFMRELFEMQNARRFQAITAEALAWLKWLRQLAAAQQGG